MKYLIHTAVCMSMMGAAGTAIAEEFSNTPKQETLAQAIAFEKYKVEAGEAQAKKDAAEAARSSRPAQSRSAAAKSSKSGRTEGQADRSSAQKAAPQLRDGLGLINRLQQADQQVVELFW